MKAAGSKTSRVAAALCAAALLLAAVCGPARAGASAPPPGAVVVSARSLAKGHVVAPGDVYVARMAESRIPPGALRDPGEVVGRALARSVGVNVPIREPMLVDPAEVPKGRRVTLVAEAGPLRVSAPGVTLEAGRIDRAVRVVNLATRRTVTGRLVDGATVRVEF